MKTDFNRIYSQFYIVLKTINQSVVELFKYRYRIYKASSRRYLIKVRMLPNDNPEYILGKTVYKKTLCK